MLPSSRLIAPGLSICQPCVDRSPTIRVILPPVEKPCEQCGQEFMLHRWFAATDEKVFATMMCLACAQLVEGCQVCRFSTVEPVPWEQRRPGQIPKARVIELADLLKMEEDKARKSA